MAESKFEQDFEEDDLQELLEQIDVEEEAEEQAKKAKISKKPESKESEDDPVLEQAPQTIEISADKIGKIDTESSAGDDDDAAIDLSDAVMKQAKGIQSAIWQKLQEDRMLLDKYIEMFTDRINDKENVKTAYVEALTSLLNTKANTSMNSSKILDSMAKILSAIKNIKPDSGGSVDLQKLLQDSSDDFDPTAP